MLIVSLFSRRLGITEKVNMAKNAWHNFIILISRSFHVAMRFIEFTFDKSHFIYELVPKLSVETTNICSSKCVFCPNAIMKRPREHLDMMLFKKAIDEFVKLGGTIVSFNTTIGDPLCDPYLLERARFVRGYSQIKSLGFVTNLQLLHKYNIDDFFNSGINWLAISITLSGKDKYREFFGIDAYEQTLNNLIMLLKTNQRYNNKIKVVIDIKPTNERIVDRINHPDFQLVNSLTKQDLVALVERMSYYVDDWVGACKLPRYLKNRPLYPRFFCPCRLLGNTAIIFSNGKVGACSCRDFNADSELILGSLKENDLSELLQSDKRYRIFSDWLKYNKVPNLCRKCSHYLY